MEWRIQGQRTSILSESSSCPDCQAQEELQHPPQIKSSTWAFSLQQACTALRGTANQTHQSWNQLSHFSSPRRHFFPSILAVLHSNSAITFCAISAAHTWGTEPRFLDSYQRDLLPLGVIPTSAQQFCFKGFPDRERKGEEVMVELRCSNNIFSFSHVFVYPLPTKTLALEDYANSLYPWGISNHTAVLAAPQQNSNQGTFQVETANTSTAQERQVWNLQGAVHCHTAVWWYNISNMSWKRHGHIQPAVLLPVSICERKRNICLFF